MKFIMERPIKPGEKLPNEFTLAACFGVGRSTIREAVKGLVSRGILEIRRGDGTYVVSVTPLNQDPLGLARIEDKYQLLLNLFEVRLMIEPETAALACRNASEEELLQLKKLCHETEQLYLRGSNHIGRDIEFHTWIARCSRNQVVELLLPVISSAITAFASITHRTLKDETIDTHRAITKAILERDMVGARCAMTMHLTYNRQRVLKMREEKDVR